MSNIKFTGKAYCKMVLHAAKYPHCAVNGVLLAKTSSVGSKEIEFVDVVLSFHISINLTLMAEIALMKGNTNSGYYVAPDNLKDRSFEKANHQIADKITSNCTRNTSIHTGKQVFKIAQSVDGNAFRLYENPNIMFGSEDPVNAFRVSLLENAASII
ncbi:hypothetical protein NQ317_016884 [Molorchus minor]|uniref:Vitellogenin n=1 Tax=Molorchus minor TaxID=1323400 RepID=A0ABQ9IU45_9CUCU|nr:hypothetical protein NQ317_016884 [Molorchus minor]